jgi:O-antigen/teichoic acid export membrane protein
MGLFRNAASVLLTSIVRVPIGVATSVILARYLSLDARGYFAVASAISGAIVVLAQVGWPSAVIYRLRRTGAAPADAATAAFLAVLIFSGLAVGACLLLREQVSAWFLKGAPLGVLYLALATVPVMLLGLVLSGIARGIDRFAMQNWYRFALSSGRLAAFVLVLVVAGAGVLEALGANLAVFAACAVGLGVAVVRRTGIRLRTSTREFVETLKFSSKTWTHAVAANMHERIGLFMLAYLLQDPAEVALYAIAAGVVEYLRFLPQSIGTGALPQMAGLDRSRSGALTSSALRHAMLWIALSLLVAVPCGPFVIPFMYGSGYAGSVAPFLVLASALLFTTPYLLIRLHFLAMDRQGINIGIQLLSMPLNLLLNLWLIPRWGVLGAAAAGLASHGFEALAAGAIFLRSSDIGIRELLLFQRSDLEPYRVRLRGVLSRLRSSG